MTNKKSLFQKFNKSCVKYRNLWKSKRIKVKEAVKQKFKMPNIPLSPQRNNRNENYGKMLMVKTILTRFLTFVTLTLVKKENFLMLWMRGLRRLRKYIIEVDYKYKRNKSKSKQQKKKFHQHINKTCHHLHSNAHKHRMINMKMKFNHKLKENH